MAGIELDLTGLDKLMLKYKDAPKKLKSNMKKAMHASVDVLWENVPSYPPKPADTVYRRTGTLGRTLGSSQAGGKSGTSPTVYSYTATEGKFGTNLNYARFVIDPEQQAYMHRPGYKGRQGWWTMDTIKKKALDKIKQIWDDLIKSGLD